VRLPKEFVNLAAGTVRANNHHSGCTLAGDGRQFSDSSPATLFAGTLAAPPALKLKKPKPRRLVRCAHYGKCSKQMASGRRSRVVLPASINHF
jgi:hypothetical protein